MKEKFYYNLNSPNVILSLSREASCRKDDKLEQSHFDEVSVPRGNPVVILSLSKDDESERSHFVRLIVARRRASDNLNMTKLFSLFVLSFFLLISFNISAQPKFSEMSVKPGAFSRMGFGPRGIGLGNGLSALTEGNLVSYYNPASSVFQEGNSFQTGYSFLSLDRQLNFLSFTRKFEFFSSKDTSSDRRPRSTAGLSAGVINSGVSKIDGRDNNGLRTKDLSTSENLFFLGIANRFSDKFALGVTIKFYYYKLYEKMTSTSVGIDVGALYKLNDNLSFSLALNDLNSKYKWDSGPIYGQNGISSEDKFPLLKKLGVSYKNTDYNFLVVGEFESSNAGTNIIRLGAEYNIFEGLHLRGGIDQFNLSNNDWPVKPSLGFSYFYDLSDYILGVDYAYMLEPYSASDRHIIGVNFNF